MESQGEHQKDARRREEGSWPVQRLAHLPGPVVAGTVPNRGNRTLVDAVPDISLGDRVVINASDRAR